MPRFSAKPFGFLLLLRWPKQHEGLKTCNHYSFHRNVISRQQFGPSSQAETSKVSTLPLTIYAFGIQSVDGSLVLLEKRMITTRQNSQTYIPAAVSSLVPTSSMIQTRPQDKVL
jgi:hypothetical protein